MLERIGETHLNSLPEQKISSMHSFTSNMNYHITLQTKGSSICLAVEESYIEIDWKGKHISNRHHRNTIRIESGNFLPGAFSHMSQRGTSLGLARPTLTCLLASLLHMWTCHLQNINLWPIWLNFFFYHNNQHEFKVKKPTSIPNSHNTAKDQIGSKHIYE